MSGKGFAKGAIIGEMSEGVEITEVGPGDVLDLLPLLRAYCDFYRVYPADDALELMVRALIEDPREGVQFICRDGEGRAVAFATVFWTWSTLSASRVGVMHDLYVNQEARGRGTAERLIARCREACHGRGATELVWQTAPGNGRAQAVYDRIGAVRSQWIDYSLSADPEAADSGTA